MPSMRMGRALIVVEEANVHSNTNPVGPNKTQSQTSCTRVLYTGYEKLRKLENHDQVGNRQ
jgi:hypothetical protein